MRELTEYERFVIHFWDEKGLEEQRIAMGRFSAEFARISGKKYIPQKVRSDQEIIDEITPFDMSKDNFSRYGCKIVCVCGHSPECGRLSDHVLGKSTKESEKHLNCLITALRHRWHPERIYLNGQDIWVIVPFCRASSWAPRRNVAECVTEDLNLTYIDGTREAFESVCGRIKRKQITEEDMEEAGFKPLLERFRGGSGPAYWLERDIIQLASTIPKTKAELRADEQERRVKEFKRQRELKAKRRQEFAQEERRLREIKKKIKEGAVLTDRARILLDIRRTKLRAEKLLYETSGNDALLDNSASPELSQQKDEKWLTLSKNSKTGSFNQSAT